MAEIVQRTHLPPFSYQLSKRILWVSGACFVDIRKIQTPGNCYGCINKYITTASTILLTVHTVLVSRQLIEFSSKIMFLCILAYTLRVTYWLQIQLRMCLKSCWLPVRCVPSVVRLHVLRRFPENMLLLQKREFVGLTSTGRGRLPPIVWLRRGSHRSPCIIERDSTVPTETTQSALPRSRQGRPSIHAKPGSSARQKQYNEVTYCVSNQISIWLGGRTSLYELV